MRLVESVFFNGGRFGRFRRSGPGLDGGILSRHLGRVRRGKLVRGEVVDASPMAARCRLARCKHDLGGIVCRLTTFVMRDPGCPRCGGGGRSLGGAFRAALGVGGWLGVMVCLIWLVWTREAT